MHFSLLQSAFPRLPRFARSAHCPWRPVAKVSLLHQTAAPAHFLAPRSALPSRMRFLPRSTRSVPQTAFAPPPAASLFCFVLPRTPAAIPHWSIVANHRRPAGLSRRSSFARLPHLSEPSASERFVPEPFRSSRCSRSPIEFPPL